MEKLPLEIKVLITSELSLKDRLKLRTLNKKWRALIDSFFGAENLAITDKNVRIKDFFGSDKLVDCHFVTARHVLENDYLELRYCAKIRRLSIDCEYDIDSEKMLHQLNRLELLMSLEIKRLNVETSELNFEALCPNLKYLKIGYVYFYDKTMTQTIHFIAPKLTHLKFTSVHEIFNRFTFSHPESLNYLKVFRYVEEILNFVNLVYLFVNDAYFFPDEFYSTDLLTKLTKLDEFYLFGSPEMFRNLIKKKAEMNKTTPKIYYRNERLNYATYELLDESDKAF